ncbi:MAG: hypothetical protein M0P31_17685 [Solirubrobacteraceae bacterium]|nr:hypothetical protein [Solirubrobacteraceae bacterium]
MRRCTWKPDAASSTALSCTFADGVRGEVWGSGTPEGTTVWGGQIVDVHAEYEEQYRYIGEFPTPLAAQRAVEDRVKRDHAAATLRHLHVVDVDHVDDVPGSRYPLPRWLLIQQEADTGRSIAHAARLDDRPDVLMDHARRTVWDGLIPTELQDLATGRCTPIGLRFDAPYDTAADR